MSHFDNWAERYSERFVVLLVVSAVMLALTCGVYAWLQQRRRRGDSGILSKHGVRDSIVALGVLYPILFLVSLFLMSLFLLFETLGLLLLSLGNKNLVC